MSFISLYFLLFVAVVITVYFVTPKRFRWIVLLVASYIFYLVNDLRAVAFIVLTTLSTYLATRLMKSWTEKQKNLFSEKDQEWLDANKKDFQKQLKKKKKLLLIFTLLFNFGILFMLKYFSTLADGFANLIGVTPLGLEILLPLGISFYIFQSISYLVDVYWGKVDPEKNIFKFAVFISFFPQLIQGPISRYNQLAPQLLNGNDFKLQNLKSGLLLMLWGYFKKLVIADRANILYESIMQNYAVYQGPEIVLGMLCYVLKLYCDFSGGIDIARGTATCLGINMVPNFERPFFAQSVGEYWRRWHMSLGDWMKDYVFYPITLSKGYSKFIKGCKKTFKSGVVSKAITSAIPTFIVFLLVGIWHGPNLTFVLFGIYNGIVIITENTINEFTKHKKAKKERSKFARGFSIFLHWAITFIIVYFGKYLSAAPDVATAFAWFAATFDIHSFSTLFGNIFNQPDFTNTNFIILGLATAFLIFIEVMQERGAKIREWILGRKTIWQWVIFYVAIILIILLTAYDGSTGGFAYEQV